MNKASGSNPVNSLKQIHVFEENVVRCESKNGLHKNTSSREVGLHAQDLLIILCSIVNIIGGEKPIRYTFNKKGNF